jgi:RNA polymerase sigma factor (sigma-70 family)
MTDGLRSDAFQDLRRSLLAPDGAGLTDGQLLELFVAHRDGAAFEALIRRHGPMVLGVCRRVTRHVQDAEDAFQATFLVLARRAAVVQPQERVGNWLYGVAHRTSLKVRAKAAQYSGRERPLEEAREPAVEQPPDRPDLAPVLDAELSRLPAIYRAPLVLCDLGGRPRKEAARQLGIPEGTLSSRLNAARKKLADRLTRRGVAVTTAALAPALSPAAEVPPTLIDAAVRGGLLTAAGRGAETVVSQSAVALADHTARSLALSRLKVVSAVLTALLASGALVVGIASAPSRHPQDAPPPAPQPADAGRPAAPGPAAPVSSGIRTHLQRTEWSLAAVDVAKGTLSVSDRPGPPAANSLALTDGPNGRGVAGFSLDGLPIEPDAAVEIDGKPATLADLRPGMRVKLGIAAERLAVTRITAKSLSQPPLGCTITAVNPDGKAIAVTVAATGVRMEGLVLTPDTRIEVLTIGDNQGARFRDGRLSDLKVGTVISLDLAVGADGAIVVRRIQTAK